MKIKKLLDYLTSHQAQKPYDNGIVSHGSDHKDYLVGTYQSDTLFGYEQNDILSGRQGHDYLYGGQDRDKIYGGSDNDMILGEDGNDRLYGQWGADHIEGGQGYDKIFAGRGNDYIDGGYDNDYIYGGSGNDWIVGGHGNDKMWGNSGADTFAFYLYQGENGLISQGHDSIFSFRKNDSLSFSGDIHNLDDLAESIHHIKHFGRTLKIVFEDYSSLKIYGLYSHGKINDVYDLANHININFHTEYRSIDGTYNNVDNPYQAGIYEPFLRVAPADYADGLNMPSGASRPSPRVISNELFDQDTSVPNPFGTSDFFWLWGQFIDHDIDLTIESDAESFDIAVPFGDVYFDPFFTGTQAIPMHRSAYDPETGNVSPREQINGITPYIDASMIYGSDPVRASYLRAPDGKLKVSNGDLLPFNLAGLSNAGGTGDNLFLAGDIRANENVALTSLHTLFVREHNRLVDELKLTHPEYTAEELYQEAKMQVEAIIQVITYRDFLPLLLGENALPNYIGYDASINPQIANEFATAAFRLGHTLLSAEVERVLENGQTDVSHLSLAQAFFRPDLLQQPNQLESILRGVSVGQSEAVDTMMVDSVRNFLFGPPGAGGLDLASLNLQRGRDHGLADYNSVREAYGLAKVTSFAEITSDVDMQNTLMTLYGNVENIDLFAGGLAEDPLSGSMLGPLFQTIVLDQFLRLRDGDRFFYENRLSLEQQENIETLKLSDIIERNTDIDVIQDNPFLSYQRIGGDAFDNVLNGTSASDLLIGFDGMDTLLGADGADELFGLADNDTLTGGAGNDRFVSRPGDGQDNITDFNHSSDLNPENDQIDLTAHQTTFDALMLSQQGSDTLIDINGVDQVVLSQFDMFDLTANDFIFA